ncbi:MAG: hypothetical protein AAFY02_02385 [Pseudomonadota bacterium]
MTPPFSGAEWVRLKACLSQQAALGQGLTYLALAEAVDLQPPHRIHRLTLALEDSVRADHAAGRPLLAALVHGKSGLPGRGFFDLLAELGRYAGPATGPEAAAHYETERDAALAYWREAGTDL